MSKSVALAVVAIGQSAFFALLVVLLNANRARTRARERRRAAAAADAAEPLRHWLIGTGSALRVGNAFRSLPPDLAREQIILVAARLAPSQLLELTRVLRTESWVVRTIAQARSLFWWRRLEAARLLAIVAAPRDRITVRRLLADRHPAVQAAASRCLPRIDDEALITGVIERLPDRVPAVRLFQADVLRSVPRLAVRPLLKRLQPRSPASRLQVWIQAADVLGEPQCLAAAAALHRHPNPAVRAAVASTLRRFAHPSAAAALTERIADPEWRVRVEAARALGAVAGTGAIPLLVRALSDRVWAVRLRAALTLADLGRPGRLALGEVISEADDRYARDMATMIMSLGDDTLAALGAA